MRLKHIEVFNAVMLTGTVSAAARLLHVTQPAVTPKPVADFVQAFREVT